MALRLGSRRPTCNDSHEVIVGEALRFGDEALAFLLLLPLLLGNALLLVGEAFFSRCKASTRSEAVSGKALIRARAAARGSATGAPPGAIAATAGAAPATFATATAGAAPAAATFS